MRSNEGGGLTIYCRTTAKQCRGFDNFLCAVLPSQAFYIVGPFLRRPGAVHAGRICRPEVGANSDVSGGPGWAMLAGVTGLPRTRSSSAEATLTATSRPRPSRSRTSAGWIPTRGSTQSRLALGTVLREWSKHVVTWRGGIPLPSPAPLPPLPRSRDSPGVGGPPGVPQGTGNEKPLSRRLEPVVHAPVFESLDRDGMAP